MKATSPLFMGSELVPSRIESENTCSDFCANSEGFDNTESRYRAGLTAKQITRFWTKVQRGSGCWLWTAARFRNGYGMFNAGRWLDGTQDTRYAHRVVYELTHGPIPDGLVIRHAPVICDNPPCCNPDHLLIGTQADNVEDARGQGKYAIAARRRWSQPRDVRPLQRVS